MEALTEFMIPFVGLKEGRHAFSFSIGETFFNHFEFSDFHQPKVEVALTFEKKATLMNLHFEAKGTVGLICDVTNEPFDFDLKTHWDWIVKFGDHYNDDNEECLILPHGSYQVHVAQPIFEMLVLTVPFKKVHPGVSNGTLHSEILKRLEELQPKVENDSDDDSENDPRWDKLKDLL